MSYSLFLYPDQASEISQTELLELLTRLEFCDHPASQHSSLPAGKQLMDYITFLGCSPALKLGELEPSITIHRFRHSTGLGGDSVTTIRYPGCKHPVEDTAARLSPNPEYNHWTCPVCGQQGKNSEINWRKTAGFSNLFIEVTHIFPNEAIPSDKLLCQLKTLTQLNWLWFYSRSRHSPAIPLK